MNNYFLMSSRFFKLPRFILAMSLLMGFSMSVLAETVWIDVRSAEEFAGGHVQNAVLMPHDQIAQLISDRGVDKDAEIHLYCRSGRRAEMAREVLLQMGYLHVTNHGSLENALDDAKKMTQGEP